MKSEKPLCVLLKDTHRYNIYGCDVNDLVIELYTRDDMVSKMHMVIVSELHHGGHVLQ